MISGLQVWEDYEARSAPEQMAMDEALLHGVRCPVVRFYRWTVPAVTFGYAQRYADIRAGAGGLPAIRRWTGGGTVFHGEDLTVALAVPASDGFSRLQTGVIYQRIHEAILGVVGDIFAGARLARPDDCRPGPACFQSPALNDILHGGKKICGGALRRGRRGLLYQGSLHGNFSALSLGQSLCSSVVIFEPEQEIFQPCVRLTKEKYGTDGWNQMR
jgi:lipoyl(octanoyl) transferase